MGGVPLKEPPPPPPPPPPPLPKPATGRLPSGGFGFSPPLGENMVRKKSRTKETIDQKKSAIMSRGDRERALVATRGPHFPPPLFGVPVSPTTWPFTMRTIAQAVRGAFCKRS
eukprot:TRINITY_DN9186_c0_g1_i1.p1 TRINITY_DN9186_c0_g1~~TRINITY_DN9186_c0_g1_i1.p1  ORF type:complete len:113 (-),score=16.49 TRINITY_DN9186_c0_g1_i1:1-339(-)